MQILHWKKNLCDHGVTVCCSWQSILVTVTTAQRNSRIDFFSSFRIIAHSGNITDHGLNIIDHTSSSAYRFQQYRSPVSASLITLAAALIIVETALILVAQSLIIKSKTLFFIRTAQIYLGSAIPLKISMDYSFILNFCLTTVPVCCHLKLEIDLSVLIAHSYCPCWLYVV